MKDKQFDQCESSDADTNAPKKRGPDQTNPDPDEIAQHELEQILNCVGREMYEQQTYPGDLADDLKSHIDGWSELGGINQLPNERVLDKPPFRAKIDRPEIARGLGSGNRIAWAVAGAAVLLLCLLPWAINWPRRTGPDKSSIAQSPSPEGSTNELTPKDAGKLDYFVSEARLSIGESSSLFRTAARTPANTRQLFSSSRNQLRKASYDCLFSWSPARNSLSNKNPDVGTPAPESMNSNSEPKQPDQVAEPSPPFATNRNRLLTVRFGPWSQSVRSTLFAERVAYSHPTSSLPSHLKRGDGQQQFPWVGMFGWSLQLRQQAWTQIRRLQLQRSLIRTSPQSNPVLNSASAQDGSEKSQVATDLPESRDVEHNSLNYTQQVDTNPDSRQRRTRMFRRLALSSNLTERLKQRSLFSARSSHSDFRSPTMPIRTDRQKPGWRSNYQAYEFRYEIF